jgi:glycosyltransferase involved in cell wall biosynthesis
VQSAGKVDSPLAVRLLRYWLAAGRLASQVDVVDAHFALYALLPVRFGALRRAPLVVHFQGPWADESAEGRGQPNVAARRLIEKLVYRRADEIVVLSGAFRQILVERYGVSPWRVHVVGPGVDLEMFRPGDSAKARANLGIDPGDRVAVAVRRLVPRMGIDLLLDAWAEVAEGNSDRRLLLVGEGPLRSELSGRARALGISESVRFVGRVSDELVRDCYRAADMSIVPSVALEGFGLVVLESLASGTPPVVTDVGGLPEAVVGLDPSLTVPAGDAGALARRLQAAFEGTAPLPDEATCRRYASKFSWTAVAEANLRVYERAVAPVSNRRLRVVYLDHCAQLSGGELALLRLLTALSNVDAHVILAEEGPLVRRLLQSGISVEVLPMDERSRGVPRSEVRLGAQAASGAVLAARYSGRLARRLRRWEPDVVHANSLKAGVYGTAAARLAGIPAVWHIRDRISDEYLPAPAVALVRQLARRIPDAVIANSESTLTTLKLPAGRGTVIPSYLIPTPSPLPDQPPEKGQPGSTDRPLALGMVGRIARWKGQDVFLQAFARAFPDGPERAVIVGAPLFGHDDIEYADGLKALTDELGIAHRVEFMGFTEDPAGVLEQMDIAVHASVVAEPFGQVVVEAMAAGLPIVAADGGGPAEIVTHEVDGLLYPAGDIGALASLLCRLAADVALRTRLAQAAQRRAGNFTPEAAVAELMLVYDRVLKSRSRD